MTEARVKRRLAAILAADVASDSRLMGVNEEGTLAALKVYRRELIYPNIEAHRGRIVKTTGDGTLVEFASAVDAVRDFSAMQKRSEVDHAIANRPLLALEVDAAGLNALDRRCLSTIALNYGGGPVGLDAIAVAFTEPCDAVEEIIEPYLVQIGFLQRTSRGRRVTSRVFDYLSLTIPSEEPKEDPFGSAAPAHTHGTIH